jgi:hypothetical protein
MCTLLLASAASSNAISVEKFVMQMQKANCVLWFHKTKSVMAVQAEPTYQTIHYAWCK